MDCNAKLLSWRIKSNSRMAQAHIVREVALGLILVESELVE